LVGFDRSQCIFIKIHCLQRNFAPIFSSITLNIEALGLKPASRPDALGFVEIDPVQRRAVKIRHQRRSAFQDQRQ
jgi:hypothetical protein